MASLKLSVTARKDVGTAGVRKLRREGLVPAILYGAGEENIPLQVDAKTLYKVLHGKAGEHAIIDLTIRDNAADKTLEKTVIVKEVQHDYMKDAILHIDFSVISLQDKIVVSVPVMETGEAAGLSEGGILEHITRELEIECLPTDMPDNITVDVTELRIGDSIRVSDLTPPPGVTILDEPEKTVITLKQPKIEKEEEPVAAEEGAPAEEAAKAEEKAKDEDQQKEGKEKKEKKEKE
jgi:large subunit ribosomal protein L25